MSLNSLTSKIKIKCLYFPLIIIYALFLIYFYYTFVPLVPSFQKALVPLLFIVFTLTLIKIDWGLLAFIFIFPLINFLPYVFHIFEHIPHAPTSLVLFLFLMLGWLFHQALFAADKTYPPHPLKTIMSLYAVLVLLSGLITFLRYGNFSPFLTDGWPELIVNANGVRAGGARMSVLFSSLNLTTGLMFSLLLFPYLKKKFFQSLALNVLLLSYFFSLLFGLFQIISSAPFARPQLWIILNQFQSTYKDPNAFAFFLAAFLTLTTAIFIMRKKWRLPSIGLFGLSFFCLLSSGTRSALLASLIGIIFVLLSSIRKIHLSRRQRTGLNAAFLMVIIGLFLILILFSSSILARRFSKSWEQFKTGAFNELFSGKLTLWRVAVAMFNDYALSGVGVGAYIVELPNYVVKLDVAPVHTDSAENAVFQVLAELGLFGILLVLILVIKFIKEAKKSWQLIVERENKILATGFVGSLLACLVNLMFHSYIGSFEAKYLFWFLATWLLASGSKSPEINEIPIKQSSLKPLLSRLNNPTALKIGAIAFLVLFAVSHLWNSLTRLSLPQRTREFGWKQDFGFYQWEKDWRGLDFRWTKKAAGLAVERLGPKVVLSLVATHPDIEKNPVTVKIFLADDWFKKKRELYSLELKNKDWHNVEIPLDELPQLNKNNSSAKMSPSSPQFSDQNQPQWINLRFETTRHWNPGLVLNVPDPRNIACGLGQIWYSYPQPKTEDNIIVLKKLSDSEWKGPQGAGLAASGSAELSFSVEEDGTYLRLQVRGQKAAGLGPLLEVSLDGQLEARTMLEKEEWTYLYLPKVLKTGVHRLKVEFLNDYYAPSLGQDRNLFLGSVEIIHWP